MEGRVDQPIIYHGDDYGANPEISGHILDCIEHGALYSFSILPNSTKLSESMELYRERKAAFPQKPVKMSIHFNIAEGVPLAGPGNVPHLVNSRGTFGISFFKLLCLSFTPQRAVLKKELKREFSYQLKSCLPYVDEIRIDSHQHYHMIPLVLESILEVCKEASDKTNKPVTFIRVPAEPLVPFIKHPAIWPTIRPVNIVKNLVLNSLNILDRGLLKDYKDKTAVFFGIILSGGMDLKRVSLLLPDFKAIAQKRGQTLEVLAHPGGVREPVELMDPENKDCVDFYMSHGRRDEKTMMLNIQ